MSLKRFLSAVSMIGISALAVINSWAFILVIMILTIGGLYEFFYMIKKKGIPIYSYVGIFIGMMIPVSIFFKFELTRNWELGFIVLGFLTILLMQFARHDNSNAIIGISTTLFGILYVSWFFSFLIKIRGLLPGAEGIKLLAFILLVAKSGDIGAFLTGVKFGKHPLFPQVSPNKSLEGALGGLLFSVIFAVLFGAFLPPFLQSSILYVIYIGAFFGLMGQVGDLSESLIKRDCNVKDSGKLLPGMGGILDMIDSLLFAAPAFYLFISSALARP